MKNPAEFAQPLAEKMMLEGYFTGSETNSFDIDRERFLSHMADILGMTDTPYEAAANAALVLPLDGGDRLTWRFDAVDFTGELVEYSAVNSPRTMGRKAINALCLTFQNVTLLPHGDRLSNVALYVPAHAVGRINEAA